MSDPTRTDEHRRYRELLGAYVANQLEGADLADLERHLKECASCRAEEAELRAVAELLSVTHSPESVEYNPPPELEDRVVAAVLAEGRSRRGTRGAARDRRHLGWWGRSTTGLAAAAAILAVVIGLTAVFFSPDRQGPPGPGELEQIAFSGTPEGVSTDAAVIAHTWGTEVQLEVEGLQAGGVYTVMLERDGGEPAEAGTFIGVEARPVECRLNGAVLRQDARAIFVTDEAGEVVMRSDLAPRPDLV